MPRSLKYLALMALATVIMIAACDNSGDSKTNAQDGHEGHDHGNHAAMFEGVTKAICVMSPTEGNAVAGWVKFEESESTVTVSWEVTGLEPNAKHAIHVHEFGDISKTDGTGTGGHYNPEGHDHALPDGDNARHAGDLGNLQADADGKAAGSITVTNISVAGVKNPVIGRGMIIHAKVDDGGQPTGNAGARISQGVIGIAK